MFFQCRTRGGSSGVNTFYGGTRCIPDCLAMCVCVCAPQWIRRGLSAGRARELHATAEGAAGRQVQPGRAVPADIWRGVRSLPQRLRQQRCLRPAVVPGGRHVAVLHQKRQPALGRRHAVRGQRDLPARGVRVHRGGDAAAGKKKRRKKKTKIEFLSRKIDEVR